MKYFSLLLAGIVLVLIGCGQPESASPSASAIPWVTDWDSAFAQAREQNKPVLVDFYATWCGPCKAMDKEIFPQAGVVEELKNWVPVKIDVDKHPDLARKFDVQGIPMMVLLDAEQKVLAQKTGMMGASDLVAFARENRSAATP